MDSLFFYVSKFAWALLSPDSLLVLLITAGWGGAAARLTENRKTSAERCLLLLALLPVGAWLLWPLESRFPSNPELPAEIDGIVVLGGAVDAHKSALWEQPQMNEAGDRITAFLSLSQRYPDAVAIFSGGSGAVGGQQFREADLMPSLIENLGMDPSAFIYENESRDTYENAVLSRQLLAERYQISVDATQNWILVTSAFHMPRSVAIFCGQQWPVIPYPVDHRTYPGQQWRLRLNLSNHLVDVHTAVREWAGLVAYRLSGRTPVLLPSRSAAC